MSKEISENVIFYGPPGTGKTYHLNQILELYQESTWFRTKEDWIDENIGDATWWQTLFMVLYELNKATVNELMEHPYFKAKAVQCLNNNSLRQTCWEALQSHAILESTTVQRDISGRRAPYVFNRDMEGAWFLAGDWQESCATWVERVERIKQEPKNKRTIQRYEFVTFHQSYSYEDFIEGIRPEATADGRGVNYSVKSGVFKRLCERARKDPRNRYAIFIDEINRGNLAKIFGELITLIELDKRAEYDDEGNLLSGMELTLPYSGVRFGVPFNVNIYGSMNTADRSIALMDIALRRRFYFKEFMPDAKAIMGDDNGNGTITDDNGDVLDLRKLLNIINKRITYLLCRDQTIGHAFFTSVEYFSGLLDVLYGKIIPLLQEIFYNNWRRIRLVLADTNAPAELQIIKEYTESAADFFGEIDDELPESKRYELTPRNQISIAAIRKIYEPLT